LEAVEDFMAAAEGFMGVAVTLLGVILAVDMIDMGGAAAVTAGEVVTGAAGMVVVGTGAAGMVVVRIGMAVLPTGGGVTHTRMVTDLMVGNGDKQKNLNRGWKQIYADRGAKRWRDFSLQAESARPRYALRTRLKLNAGKNRGIL
jgi:hypothetical protein